FKFTDPASQFINLTFLQNIGLGTPFKTTDPSAAFVTTAGGAIGPAVDRANLTVGAGHPDIGTLNGGLPGVATPDGTGGPDIMLQTDTNQTFGVAPITIVPEPMTAGLGMMGIAALGLSALRRRRA